jgi:hypothetical protein
MQTSLNLSDCKIWKFCKDKDGYGLCKNSQGKTARAHREAYKAKYGEIPNGKMVLHRCNNPSCVNLDHLYLGDGYDNMRDRKLAGNNTGWKGYDRRGTKNPRAILSDDDIAYIKANRKYGMGKILAAKFNVSVGHIRRLWCKV